MKTFVIFLSKKDSQSFSETLLQSHKEYLEKLHHNHQLVFCGPFSNNQEAIIILRAVSLQAAHALMKEDPFISSHYYQEYEIREVYAANPQNNWLVDESIEK